MLMKKRVAENRKQAAAHHRAFPRFIPRPLRRALARLQCELPSPLAGAPRRLAGARVGAAPVGGAALTAGEGAVPGGAGAWRVERAGAHWAWAAVRAVRPVGAGDGVGVGPAVVAESLYVVGFLVSVYVIFRQAPALLSISLLHSIVPSEIISQ